MTDYKGKPLFITVMYVMYLRQQMKNSAIYYGLKGIILDSPLPST